MGSAGAPGVQGRGAVQGRSRAGRRRGAALWGHAGARRGAAQGCSVGLRRGVGGTACTFGGLWAGGWVRARGGRGCAELSGWGWPKSAGVPGALEVSGGPR